MKFNLSAEQMPKHIAIIMDGNGRWAKSRLLPRKMGHRAGVNTIHKIVDSIFALKIPYVTIYAFSTENKERPKEEVDALIELMSEYFSKLINELIEKKVALRFMGDLSFFPEQLQKDVLFAKEQSKSFTGGILNICLNYGARDEILRAAEICFQEKGELDFKKFESHLYSYGLPDPDMIIRTGGEKRLSNFLLYQAAYSELFFTDTLWPDFNETELKKILIEYSKRNRRFGKV